MDNWLLHNPIADIHGPAFLVVYAVIATLAVLAARGIVLSRDRSSRRPPPPVPDTFDPCEVAYLRGGANAVIRTVLYGLYQRGLAQAVPPAASPSAEPSEVVAATDPRDTGARSELEQRVLRAIAAPVNPARLFQDRMLADDMERLCEPYRSRLEADELLRTADDKASATMVPFMASVFLVVLSVYKIALADGRPFGFLIMLTILALIVTWIAAGSAAYARLTGRGKAWLGRIQMAYRDQPHAAARDAAPQHDGHSDLQPDLVSVAMVGLFGMGILSATPDAAFARMFATSTSSSSGGCGSGCGSGGGCGGGGCGGGCGG
jgi:uncharacterized protein (TIGR04222 family)